MRRSLSARLLSKSTRRSSKKVRTAFCCLRNRSSRLRTSLCLHRPRWPGEPSLKGAPDPFHRAGAETALSNPRLLVAPEWKRDLDVYKRTIGVDRAGREFQSHARVSLGKSRHA